MSKSGSGTSSQSAVQSHGSALSKAAKFLTTAWPAVVIPAVGVVITAGVLLFANLSGGQGGYGGGGEPSPSPTVNPAAFIEESQTPEPSGEPSQEPSVSPSATVTSTVTATPTLEPPTATGLQNVKCRYGPDMVFDILTYLWKDESALIVGRNSNDTWWQIERNDGHGVCWVWDGVVALRGDLSIVPFVASPPTPTPADTEPPQVDIFFTPDEYGHPNNNEQITFTATARDNRGVERIEIWLKSSSDNVFSLVHTCTGVNECSYTGGPYSHGILTYQAKAYDEAGNEGLTLKEQVEVVIVLY